MMGPGVTMLPCGTRLHLQHGPIDLVIGVDGDRRRAFAAARARFATVLDELVSELPALRRVIGPGSGGLVGAVARRMWQAAHPHRALSVTPMIAVAGAVADEILQVITTTSAVQRAYVNNGGDIALYLAPGAQFTSAMSDYEGFELGRIVLRAGQGVGGIATSGLQGRSFSLGIADSVTVLAQTAAEADAAATLIANAVDLPDHPGICRAPASDLVPDSDLGARLVTTYCPSLVAQNIASALAAGRLRAQSLVRAGQIHAAALFLQGEALVIGEAGFTVTDRTCLHA